MRDMTEAQAEALLQLVPDEVWSQIEGLAESHIDLITIACGLDESYAAMIEAGQW